jgi:hypothetical protein
VFVHYNVTAAHAYDRCGGAVIKLLAQSAYAVAVVVGVFSASPCAAEARAHLPLWRPLNVTAAAQLEEDFFPRVGGYFLQTVRTDRIVNGRWRRVHPKNSRELAALSC